MRRTLALAVLALVLAAGEADPRAQAKALWLEAAQASDLWTCLQLEEWAREQKPALRLASAIGGSQVVGSTLHACPERIHAFADLGDRLLVATDHRLYTLAPDGRPLRRSVPLQPASWFRCFGHGGRVVASVRAFREEAGAAQQIELGVFATEGGKTLMQAVFPFAPAQTWTEDAAVADDGSAVALTVRNPEREGPGARGIAVVVDGKPNVVEGLRGLAAVGRRGVWLVAVDEGHRVVVRGGARRRIAAHAAGPGLLAVVAKGRPGLILADGSERPLDPGLSLGKDPELATVGNWLVLKSGSGAKAVSQGDLLGEGAGAEVEQPCTLVLWRWDDLVADPAAKPALTLPGHLSVGWHHPAALLVWQGRQVDQIDLAGREPQRSRWVEAPAEVSWAYADQHACGVFTADGQRRLLGPDSVELWAGKAEELRLVRRDLALGWIPGKAPEERHWRLFHLAADPAKRQTVALALDPVDQSIDVGFREHDHLVGRHDGAWRQVGLDGKLIDQGSRNAPQPRPRPPCDSWFAPAGRFYVDGARIHAKLAGRPAEAARRLQLQDAWRFGQVTLLLQDDRSLLSIARRRGEPTEIGRRPGAARFGLANRQAALLGGDGQATALLGAGPSIIPRVPEGAKSEEMPSGPWRLDEAGRFTPPRGRQLAWDAERVGIWPQRLRSPDDSGLFVITAAVLIELDPDLAKLVGRDP